MKFRVNMSVDVEARSSSEAEDKALVGDYSGAFVTSVDQASSEDVYSRNTDLGVARGGDDPFIPARAAISRRTNEKR